MKKRTNVSLSPETRNAVERYKRKINVSRLCDDHILRVLTANDSDGTFLSMKEEIEPHEREILIIKSRAQALLGKTYDEYYDDYSRGYHERAAMEMADRQSQEEKRKKFIDDIGIRFMRREGRTEAALDSMLTSESYKSDLKDFGITKADVIQELKNRGVLA